MFPFLIKNHGNKKEPVAHVLDLARSPLWRSGGVSFGPQPRVRTLQVNKQVEKECIGKYSISLCRTMAK